MLYAAITSYEKGPLPPGCVYGKHRTSSGGSEVAFVLDHVSRKAYSLGDWERLKRAELDGYRTATSKRSRSGSRGASEASQGATSGSLQNQPVEAPDGAQVMIAQNAMEEILRTHGPRLLNGRAQLNPQARIALTSLLEDSPQIGEALVPLLRHPCLFVPPKFCCAMGDACDLANYPVVSCISYLRGNCSDSSRCQLLHPQLDARHDTHAITHSARSRTKLSEFESRRLFEEVGF